MIGPAFAAVLAAANVFVNADMSIEDGLGSPCGWTYYCHGCMKLKGRALPDGSAIRLWTDEARRDWFRQYPIRLVAGAKYRFSCEVKCELGEGDAFSFHLFNHWMAKNVRIPFPKSTGGAWKELVWEGPMIDTRENDYSIGFEAKAGRQGRVAEALVRNVRLEPLDAAAAAGSQGVKTNSFTKIVPRIVPIDRLLGAFETGNPRLTCYWPGVVRDGIATCTLVGRLDGGPAATAAFGADARATLDFGRVPDDVSRLEVLVTDAERNVLAKNAYALKAAAKLPEGPAGRRLNNFVVELVNGPATNGEMRFFRGTPGWVWINFSDGTGWKTRAPSPAIRAWLDDGRDPVVAYDEKEPFTETMRLVEAGWHTLKVEGVKEGTRLRIHAVPPLMTTMWGGWTVREDGRCNFTDHPDYHYSFPFIRRFVLPSVNTICAMPGALKNAGDPVVKYYRDRGYGVQGGIGIFNENPNFDAAYARACFTGTAFDLGYHVNVDELLIVAPSHSHYLVSEEMWKMVERNPALRLNTNWADASTGRFNNPAVHVSLIAAIAQSGYGTAAFMPECYSAHYRTEAEYASVLENYDHVVNGIADLVPIAKGHTMYCMSPYVNNGHWTDAGWPEVDSKAHYAYLMHVFATDPKFAPSYGVSGGLNANCDEETQRWFNRLRRYYCIEGGTEDLAKARGYNRLPGFVKDPDFREGFRHWTAEGDHVKATEFPRLTNVQQRQKCGNGTGNSCAEFVSAETPSRLSQKVVGLEPGRLYALHFVTEDAANLEKPSGTKRPPLALSAKLVGAEEIEPLRFVHRNGGFGKVRRYVNTHRYVFRAKCAEATLVFTDRDERGGAVPVGNRQLLNYVVFRPYYLETPEELDEVVGCIKGER